MAPASLGPSGITHVILTAEKDLLILGSEASCYYSRKWVDFEFNWKARIEQRINSIKNENCVEFQ